jgi:Transposase DDE domain
VRSERGVGGTPGEHQRSASQGDEADRWGISAQLQRADFHGCGAWLIVAVAVTQEANDSAQLLPAVDRVEERLKKKPQQMVADGGYTTRDNIEKLAGREIDFLGSMRWENVPGGAMPNRLPPSAFLYQPERIAMFAPKANLARIKVARMGHPPGYLRFGRG